MQNILMILTEFPPSIGGMQAQALAVARYFAREGHKVLVFTYRSDEDTQSFDALEPYDIHRCLSRISYQHNLRVLEREIRCSDIDFVYSSTIFYGILQRLTGKPVVCRSVGNDIMRPWIIYPFHFGSQLLAKAAVERLFKRFLKRVSKPSFLEIFMARQRKYASFLAAKSASLILANSEFTAKKLAEAGVSRHRIQTLVGGVSVSDFQEPTDFDAITWRKKQGFEPHHFVILSVSRLVRKKNIHFLLPAFAELHQAFPQARFVIVGDGPELSSLQSLAFKKLKLGNAVHFVGSIPHAEVMPYFWASDLLVLASRVYKNLLTGFADAETMGRVLCEANAAGLPVLAANSGGIPSVICSGENGLLFEENNEEDIVRQLKKLLEDKALRSHLRVQGKIYAKKYFDWQAVMQKYEEAFEVISKA
ncbi:MAG: glycosyltransferase family 4 protein [Bernardetiaceae bacterium]|nr:glycosyltransferase family 4 protein [Bernardetiaceae bacterium]